MFDDQASRNFLEREARLGDEIARRAARIPRPRKAHTSLQPSTGPTFAEDVTRALARPGPRSETHRPVSASGGATSFHLKVTSVVGDGGAAQEPNKPSQSRRRAAQHQLYIERDGAVERLPLTVQLPANLPQQQAYIERLQAVEQDGGELASFGNIGRTAEERAAFWAAVEECAHPARNYAVATCYRSRSPAFWHIVSEDPTAPACLKAVEGPGPHKLKFKTEAEAAPVMAFADTHGEIGPDAKFELAIVFSPGRASRIQTRLIIELPCELTPKQRLRLAKRICRALFGPQIRYWAAIHAPDAHNDSRNFHLHVVFSDLPTRKIRDKSGQRVWDFTILELREDKENRNKRWHRPYRQLRDRTFSARNWIKQTRERVAELVNDALAEAGVERRVDPRSYSKMGIDREPEPRAPGWAYSLEKRGVETAAARPAIEAQWQRARQRLSQQYDDFQPDARIAARFGAAFRRVSDRIDTTLRLEALTAGEQWRSAVMRQNAAEADAAALRFNMAKIRSRFAPPIETGDGRNRDADLAQLATIEAELLAEIRQQAAAAAASEARALETLAKFEKELGVGGEQVRLGDGTEGQSPQTVSAHAIAINGLVDSAMRPSSAHSIADDELWTLHDQCAALRARTLALASSSALACANLNDTIAADQRRAAQTPASLSQFDDLGLADPGVPLPVAGTPPQSRSAREAAHHRELDQRLTQEAVTSGNMSVAQATPAPALSASAATNSELALAAATLAGQRQEAVVEPELSLVEPTHVAVDAAERPHAGDAIATSGRADTSAQDESRHREIQRQSDIAAADEFFEIAARALALRASGAALAAELTEYDASQNRRQRAIAAEATAAGGALLQTDPRSSTLAPIPPMVADENDERRHRQRRRDRQRELDLAAGDESLAIRANTLALSSSASLVEFAITADETSLNLARRVAFANEQPIASGQQEPRHREIQRQSDIAVADQFLEIATRTLALRASGAALAAELTEYDASQNRRQHAIAAEATAAGGVLLQTDPISTALALIPPMVADENEERRRRQRRRERQREQDYAAGDESLAIRAHALALSSSASLVEFEIIAHETSLNLARRAAFAAERAIAEERAQFDQRTALAADAANAADPASAFEEEQADDQRPIEHDVGSDRSANRRDDRPLSGASHGDAQFAEGPAGAGRQSAGGLEQAERATTTRRDMGAAPNPAGGDRSRDLGESRSGAGRSDAEEYWEMRPVSPSGGGVWGISASSDRQTDDQPADAGVSGGAQVPAGARRHDVQSVPANAGRADQSIGGVDRPGATRDKLMAEHRVRLQQERDRLRASASVRSIALAAARPESGASRPVAASSEHAASKPMSRTDVHAGSASSDILDAKQLAYIASLYAGVDEAERIVREVETIRAGGTSPPSRQIEADPKSAASDAISRPGVHFDSASSGAAADRSQLTSVEPTGAEEGENIPAEFEPHHAEAVTLAAPQVSASAEPRPSAKPDIEKAAPPTKEGPIIAIGGRALNNKVLQRKPPVWGR